MVRRRHCIQKIYPALYIIASPKLKYEETKVVYTECISSRVSHQSCHFLTAVQLPGADGRWMAR